MANENRIEAKHENLCVINNVGSIVLEPKVDIDALHYPSHGFCQVEKNGKYGYIDTDGELIIPIKYEKAFPFSDNGLAFVVCEDGLGGYINEHDEFEIEPIYETGSIFKFGFAAVSRNGEYIYIYKNGNKAINNTFKYAGGFSECGLAKVEEFGGRQGLMDTTSRPILMLKEGYELRGFKEDSRITTFRKGEREAVINAAGEIITGFYDQIIISPYSRLNPFLRNGLWGYIDDKGNEVIPNIYKEASEFSQDKVAFVKAFHPLAENNMWEFYINEEDDIMGDKLVENNQKYLNQKFYQINRFKKAMALAIKKDEKEIVDSSNQEDFIENDQIERYEEEGMEFEVEIFFYNKEEKEITEFIYDHLEKGREILKVKDYYVKLLWSLEDWESPGDIENVLYYVLRDGELGEYSY